MKAIWVESPGGLEVLRERELPAPEPGPEQVRVRVVCAGFNPVDAKWRAGKHAPPLPGVLGRDFSGVVDAIGAKVGGLAVGDAVLGYAGLASNGTYAEQLCVHHAQVARKPAALPFEVAAAMPVCGLTADLIDEAVGAGPGPVVIAGAAGGVGSALVGGRREVIALTRSAEGAAHLTGKLRLPEPAVVRLDLTPRKAWASIIAARFGRPAAYVDLVGGELKRLGFELVREGGRVISIVEEPADFAVAPWHDDSLVVQRSLGFQFVQLGAWLRADPPRPERYGQRLQMRVDALEPDHARLPDVQVLGPLSVATVREAHRRMEAGEVRGKMVMRVCEP